MCIIDGSVNCIIDPIANALWLVINSFFGWILIPLFQVFEFIYNIGVLLYDISIILIGLFGDVFSTNPYATILFSLILTFTYIVIFLRIYNILAGTTILGFKVPKL